MKARILFLFALVLILAGAALCADKKDKEDVGKRSVQGIVTDNDSSPIEGAVVQLKNAKTLQVVSFITPKDGMYRFHGLSKDVDYQLKADHNGASSGTRTLSSFDTRTKAVMNLKIAK